MIIDNEKFIALLVENSGIEKEKIEGYLEELISEIKVAIDENEGYEIDGFGIFSKLGANILFIPSEELETEINYKYVGMEPIELPGSATQETSTDETTSEEKENPIQGILDGEEEEYEDPFAELLNEEESEDSISDEPDPLDEEDIEAVVEEEIQNEETEEDQEIDTNEVEDSDIVNEDNSDEQVEDVFEEEESIEEETPGPDSWGIDAHKEDDQEDAFAGLLGKDDVEDPEFLEDDDIFLNEEKDEEPSTEEDEEEIDFSALESDTEEGEDFDDPFMESEEEDQEIEEDFVPVVTNVSSGIASTQEETKEEDLDQDDKDEGLPLKKSQPKKKGAPVFLYMILALVILAGSGYIAAYFGVINIKGITPNKNTQVAQANTPVNQPKQAGAQTALPVKEPADEVIEDNESAQETPDNSIKMTDSAAINTDVSEEVATNKIDSAPLIEDEKLPSAGGIISPVNVQADAKPYGLTGTATEAGNNGYTIVLYTLSRKAGADKQFETLSRNGYRVIIKENPSERYGALYRVSIGQFKSLADAAIAAEKVDSQILGNYIITKI